MRRSPAQIDALARAVLEELASHPGQTRAELSAALGHSYEALDRPVINLVQSGCLTRHGHKAHSRYWPAS
jgi:DNA-binding Lrp family transcriptional regulator